MNHDGTSCCKLSNRTDRRAHAVNAQLFTDFPLTVGGRFSPRGLHATIGAGGRTRALESVNGSIELRRR